MTLQLSAGWGGGGAFVQLCWSIVESVTASFSFIGSAMLTNYLLLNPLTHGLFEVR
jgi:hypothetical protein